jgi:uncharacterized protein (DUF1330 family)
LFAVTGGTKRRHVMNATQRSMLALIAGVAIGVGGIEALQAQQGKAPPAYLISNIEVTDTQAFPDYSAKFPAMAAAHHGRFIVRGGKTEVFDGEAPKRVVVIAFDSMQDAVSYRNSEAFQKLQPERDKVMRYITSFAVEGVPEAAPPAVGSTTPPATK